MPIGDFQLDRLLNIATGEFQVRQGRQIPDINDVTLQNGAVQLTATFLYSDLARSTVLASEYPPDVAAKVIKAFLRVATNAVRSQRGRPRSFDGDRVMGVFSGADGPASAVRAGMAIV